MITDGIFDFIDRLGTYPAGKLLAWAFVVYLVLAMVKDLLKD